MAALLGTSAALAAPYTWDASGGDPLDDGGGAWNATGGTNWFDGTTYGAWGNTSADTATFGVGSGAAGTITVGSVTANALTFNNAGSGNYVLSGGTITMAGTTPSITVNAAGTSTISSILAGSAGLAKLGSGVLLLSGANTYSGTTTISQGTLRAGSSSAIPSATTLAVNAGVFDLNGSNVTVNAITAGASAGTITNSAAGSGTSTLTMNSGNVNLQALITDGSTARTAVTWGSSFQGTPWLGNSNNTFSGGLTLKGGNIMRIWVGAMTTATNSDGSIRNSNLGTGAVTIGDSTVSTQFGVPGSSVSIYNPFVFNSGTSYADGGGAAFRVDGTGNTLFGKLTANMSPVSFSSGGAGSLTARGQITGSNGLAVQNGVTVTLSNTSASVSDYQGTTTVSSAILSLGASNQIPNGANRGNVSVASGTFRLNGFSETINGLSGSGFIDAVSGTSVLEVGDNNATSTFAGAIRDNGGSLRFTKIGTGTQTLSGSNSYSGGTQLNAGALALGNAGALGTTGTISFGGGTLQFTSSGTTDYSSRFSSAASQAYSLDTNGQSVTLGSSLTSSGGSLTKLGSGTLTISASNGYTGGTQLNGGVLAVANSGALGTAGAISFAGGTLQFTSSGTADYSSRFSSAAGQAYSLDTNGQSVTLGSSLTSSGGSLTKLGSGTLTLSASNSYSGTTTISAGVLRAGITSALPSASTLTVNSTGVLDLNGFNVAVGSLAAGASTAKITNSVVGTGTLTINNFNTAVATLIEDGGAGRNVAVVVGGGQSIPSFSNSNNTFSGGLTILSASITRLWNQAITTTLNPDGSILSSNLGTGTVTIGTTTGHAQFAINFANTSVYNPFVVNAGTSYPDGGGAAFRVDSTGNTLFGQLAANLSPVSFASGGTGSLTARGRITGTNGLLLKTSNITVTLSNTSASANNYQGATTVEAGTTLLLGASEQLPDGASAGNVAVNGSLRFNGFNETINGLSGTGTLDALSGTSTISIGGNNATSTFAGGIRNSGVGAVLGLSKIGAGTLTLSGSSSYSGGTGVNAGTLAVNGSLGAGLVSVASAATLRGSGTIGGPVSILGGGIVAPGNSPGTLTVNDVFLLADTSILNFELNATNTAAGGGINDLITGVTNLTLDGILNISGSGDWTNIANNTSWRLFNYTGTLTDNLLAIGTQPTLGAGQSLQISTATAGQVNLVIVPEPCALALAAMGVAGAAWTVSRRQRPAR